MIHHRQGVVLSNGTISAKLLRHGGHIAAFGFAPENGRAAINTLWEAPYPTADPETDSFSRLARDYGGGAAGKFLAGFTGHALCVDQFGMPSPEEEAAGVGLHGEAASATWQIAQQSNAMVAACADLPVAGLTVRRTFTALSNESVLRVEESVENVRSVDRAIHWVQHATLGPPFLVAGDSAIAASVQHAAVWPEGYEGADLLRGGVDFSWPFAPAAAGRPASHYDVRLPFQQPQSGFVCAALQTERDIGFAAAINWKLHLAMGYCFLRSNYPWLTLWEESGARQQPPWNGTVHARGLEFGTTPFPIGREKYKQRGNFLGQATERILPGGSVNRAPWLQFVAELPTHWRDIADVQVDANAIVLSNHAGEVVSIRASEATEFLMSTLRGPAK